MVGLLDGPMRLSTVSVPVTLMPQKTGPVALIAAMLDRAVEDVRAGGRLRTHALGWVCDRRAKERPGSFEWCCTALNVDVDAVRTRLVRQQSVKRGHHRQAVGHPSGVVRASCHTVERVQIPLGVPADPRADVRIEKGESVRGLVVA